MLLRSSLLLPIQRTGLGWFSLAGTMSSSLSANYARSGIISRCDRERDRAAGRLPRPGSPRSSPIRSCRDAAVHDADAAVRPITRLRSDRDVDILAECGQ